MFIKNNLLQVFNQVHHHYHHHLIAVQHLLENVGVRIIDVVATVPHLVVIIYVTNNPRRLPLDVSMIMVLLFNLLFKSIPNTRDLKAILHLLAINLVFMSIGLIHCVMIIMIMIGHHQTIHNNLYLSTTVLGPSHTQRKIIIIKIMIIITNAMVSSFN